MKNPETKTKLRAAFKMAVFGSLIITAITFAINLSGIFSETSRLAIVFYEGIPFALILELFGLSSLGQSIGKSFIVFGLLAPIADGLAVFLLLLILGFIWQFIVKSNRGNQKIVKT